MRLIGFTGDATEYCPKHAEELYGPRIYENILPALDNEGNVVGGLFDIDERHEDVVCGIPHGHRPDGSPIFEVLAEKNI